MLMLAALLAAAPADAPWPQFRGPAGAGVAPASANPPAKIGPKENVRWAVDCPSGFSSPIVVGGRVLLTAFDGGKLFTVAYAAADGKELWRKEAPFAKLELFHKIEGSPAAGTPATDGAVVVSYFGSCGLFAYDLDGNELWRHEMPTARTNNDFGSGTSPVVFRGVVYLLRDLEKGSMLAAFDLRSGSKKWEAPREGFSTSWGTPLLRETPEGAELIAPGALKMAAYDAATGKQKWLVPNLAAVNCTAPVAVGDDVLYSGWSPSGGSDFHMPSFDDILKNNDGDADKDGRLSEKESEKTFLKNFFSGNDTNKDGYITRDEWDAQVKALKAGKNGTVRVGPGGKVQWFAAEGAPYVPTPLMTEAGVLLLNHRGRATLLDPATGKSRYELENLGITAVYASPVLAAGRVYAFGLDGTALVLKADAADAPEVLHKAKFGERVAATPAVAGNRLYVRTATKLYAFGE